ncbi:MAG: phosphoadenosine phosphosulfate reductase family protein [Methanothrix sp.]|jgi:phosphoadenosine phosphosulfate reductase|uniref:phosphoadenosine phosphosulfate reductase domain-containing protein n=1 Tax=Methanothrix sp. TaxID=90426 RepID=UPI003C74AC5A
MQDRKRSFSPGTSEIFWCRKCNLPLLSEDCSLCHSTGWRIPLSPPGDVRLCSRRGRDLLRELFLQNWGVEDFLDDRLILLNKIAGTDRRDQVILEGRHIATLWFDITVDRHRLDLEIAGAALLKERAKKNLVVCDDTILKGHIKGKWLAGDQIVSQPPSLEEGDSLVLRIGKFSGVGIVRRKYEAQAIRIKDVTQRDFVLSDRPTTLKDTILANEEHLKRLEREAIAGLRDYLSRSRLPVNISFSGGKDSLASLILARKLMPRIEVLFINTGLEFPETVEYVQKLCSDHKLRLHEIRGDSDFFEQAKIFGPPAKDYRWCCKTNKLGPMTSFLAGQYPRGCVTIEGRRVYESFNRSSIKAVERNPYVPGQTMLSPIRNWRALEVMLYIHWNGELPNPLYDEDYERIGCWLCPASMQSEFSRLKESHPNLYSRWNSFLHDWRQKNDLDERYVDWGFWRWRRHPPKITEMADSYGICLASWGGMKKEISLQAVRGRSPCGLEYSVEAVLTSPQNHPFSNVANALGMLGEAKYEEDMGAALLKTDKGRATVFANGHIMIIAGREEAEELLQKVVEVILRVQMCTKCGICLKNCRRGAISLENTFIVDHERCNHCGKCAQGCIAIDEAKKILKGIGAG